MSSEKKLKSRGTDSIYLVIRISPSLVTNYLVRLISQEQNSNFSPIFPNIFSMTIIILIIKVRDVICDCLYPI